MRKRIFYIFSFIFSLVLVVSCSKLTEVKDLVDKPTAREKYERRFEKDSPLLIAWIQESKRALLDSVQIPGLPYAETGRFSPSMLAARSYEIELNQGERLQVLVQKDSTDALVFIDLFQKLNDSLNTFEHLESAGYDQEYLQQEIGQSGIYKILVQPEIAAETAFRINIFKEPVYSFPVASRGNSAVQSFWGADRDAGRRRHEGIDIFAPRGTPVVAATEGRVSSTGNKGLGGMQVWVWDRKRGNSLYYAHLDSIIAIQGMKVEPGDTLGLVGNSGNARTTAPHLHFGIYKRFQGAQNPLPYVYEIEEPEIAAAFEAVNSRFIISRSNANLRKGPSTRAEIAGKVEARDTLQLLGETNDWFHARLLEENVFIHKSLANPL